MIFASVFVLCGAFALLAMQGFGSQVSQIDARDVRGGCLQLSGWTGCPGDYLACGNVVCPPAYSSCQVSTKTIMAASGYYSSTATVEPVAGSTVGKTSSKSTTLKCADEQTCGRDCLSTGTGSTRYCGAKSTYLNPVNVSRKELDGSGC